MREFGPYQNRPVHERPAPVDIRTRRPVALANYDINDHVDWLLDIKQNKDVLAAVLHAKACGCPRCHREIVATKEWYRPPGPAKK